MAHHAEVLDVARGAGAVLYGRRVPIYLSGPADKPAAWSIKRSMHRARLLGYVTYQKGCSKRMINLSKTPNPSLEIA